VKRAIDELFAPFEMASLSLEDSERSYENFLTNLRAYFAPGEARPKFRRAIAIMNLGAPAPCMCTMRVLLSARR